MSKTQVVTALVRLWGTQVGTVSWNDSRQVGSFQYKPAFLSSGMEISPITMPLGPAVYSFPELSGESFQGLPGTLADSLPDKFGNLLINQWLARQGRLPNSLNPVERLCYIGKRGMGALEFEPEQRQISPSKRKLKINALVDLANDALSRRENLEVSIDKQSAKDAINDIIRVGTSAGGARAKAVIAWNPETNEVRSGQIEPGEGFSHWLIKLDGVTGNKDKEVADPLGYGKIEYAYHLAAKAAGLEMTPCRLFHEGGRSHFMTRRFDRGPQGQKLHMQTLCGLAHYDFNQAGSHSYEQACQIARTLDLPHAAIEELYRRAVFNIVYRNQDDHTKNISFLMDKSGAWHLSPAYDVCYSYNPNGAWTSTHQMSFNGKRDDFTADDLVEVAKVIGIKTSRRKEILNRIRESLTQWKQFAEEAQIGPSAKTLESTFRSNLVSS